MLTPAEQQQLKEANSLLEQDRKLQDEQLKTLTDKSQAYQTAVVVLTYGGFFALWSPAKGWFVEQQLLSLAGGAMLLSISFYIVFMLIQMYMMSTAMLEHGRLAQTLQVVPNSIREYENLVRQISQQRISTQKKLGAIIRRTTMIWPVFFWPSVILGIIACAVLLFIFLKHGLFSPTEILLT